MVRVFFTKISETREKAILSQSAEHKFAGVPCGIMDQWISAHGIKGSALILDCRTCTHELVPINSTELVFLGKSHFN